MTKNDNTEHFATFRRENVHPDCTLTQAIQVYTESFPGRVVPLIEELINMVDELADLLSDATEPA